MPGTPAGKICAVKGAVCGQGRESGSPDPGSPRGSAQGRWRPPGSALSRLHNASKLGGKRLAWSSESERECAGSVETTRVECPASASFTASEAAELVLPTPPFPPSMKYFRPFPAHCDAVLLGCQGDTPNARHVVRSS